MRDNISSRVTKARHRCLFRGGFRSGQRGVSDGHRPPLQDRLFCRRFWRHSGLGRRLDGGIGLDSWHGVRSGEFIRQNCDGDAAVSGPALRGRVVGNGTIFAIADRADAARVNARFFREKMHRRQGARGGKLPVAGKPPANRHVVRVADDMNLQLGMPARRDAILRNTASPSGFTTASPELNITRSRMFTVSRPWRLEMVTSLDSRSARISSSRPLALARRLLFLLQIGHLLPAAR